MNIIGGMKKKIKELNNEVETLMTVKIELTLRLKEQYANQERKEEEESKNEPGSSFTATPSTAHVFRKQKLPQQQQMTQPWRLHNNKRSKHLRRKMRRKKRIQQQSLETMRSKAMRRKKRKMRKKMKRRERKEEERKARKQKNNNKGKQQEEGYNVCYFTGNSRKKVTTFATSQMLVTFGATTRTWACTSVYLQIKKVARIQESYCQRCSRMEKDHRFLQAKRPLADRSGNRL